MKDAKFLINRCNSLRSERATWENHWQEVADYIVPNKNNIINEFTPGQKRNIHLFDNTAVHSCELLASSLHGILTNPSAPWFELTTGDEELDQVDSVRRWLQDSAIRMHRVLNNSNFQTEIHEYYIDLCAFGTSPLTIEEDKESVIRFKSLPIQECYIRENNFGIIDELHRVFEWDAKKIFQEWGEDKLPEDIKKQIRDHGNKKFKIIHTVIPTKHLQMMGHDVESNKEFTSIYVLEEKQVILEEEGFNEFPYIVGRWAKYSGEVYGRSPGMTALPEAKTINKIAETTLIGAEKAVDPPMQLPDDGFIMPIITEPGGLNYYRAGSNERIEPIFNNSRVDIGIEIIREHMRKIREAFFVEQFQLPQIDRQTAQEALLRSEEQRRLLGPLMGRQHYEFLRPMIERVFKIMDRRDQFLEVPGELDGIRLDVRYNSLIARSQRVDEGQNIMRTLNMSGPFIELDPSVADNFNGDVAVKKIAQIFGLPQEIIRSEAEKEEIREAKAQAQREFLEQQQRQQDADVAQKVAPLAGVMANSGQSG